VITYKNGNTNKLDDMLSSPPATNNVKLGTLMHMKPFTYDAYNKSSIKDEDFKEFF